MPIDHVSDVGELIPLQQLPAEQMPMSTQLSRAPALRV